MKESCGSILKDIVSFRTDMTTNEEIKSRISNDGKVTGVKLCILFLASFIACAGLSLNSKSVIIGAMLITQIVGTSIAMALGTVSADITLFKRQLLGLLFQIVVSILAATVYFLFFPMQDATPEMLDRTKTTIHDIIIASCGGVVAALGYSRKVKANNAIYGVAIAIVLLPPLCVCGYAIAHGEIKMLLGAAYLFLVNIYFAFVSSNILLSILAVPRTKDLNVQQWNLLRRKMIRNTILTIIPAIIIGYFVFR